MTEVWRPIPGWEDLYQVSSLVRIRRSAPHIPPSSPLLQRAILKPFIHDGCLKVNLSGKGGRQERRQIAHLYLLAFVGPRPPGAECCHKDGNPTNNDPANLYWGTHLKSMRNKVRAGRSARGQKNGRARLSDDVVLAILRSPEKPKDIAKRFGISRQHVYKIKSGTSWGHIGEPGRSGRNQRRRPRRRQFKVTVIQGGRA